MPQENVEIVRSALWDGVDGVPLLRDDVARAKWWAELEAIFSPDCAFAWNFQGQRTEANSPGEALRFWLDFYEPWESLYSEVERLIPVGDKVVALVRQYGRMAGSQREVEALLAAVYYVRSGRIVRAEFYTDRAEALEAAGLRE